MLRLFTLSGILLLLAGCIPEGGGGNSCERGETATCGCPGGSLGERTCQADDTFSDCMCTTSVDGGTQPDAAVCVPRCEGVDCGGDGCGGECGTCTDPQVCSAIGACVAPSADCGDATCGDDEDCSTCPADCGQCCGNGSCEGAQSENCSTCPADCGCPEGQSCEAEAQVCVPDCAPACEGRACGTDGCGGVCGECTGTQQCTGEGQCEEPSGVCGDGTCDPTENCSACASDCACELGQSCVAEVCEAGEVGAPQFLTLNTNVRRLTVGEEIVFSAVVTDPDGIDDLIGGVLEDPNGQSYGAFASSGQEGAYSMNISWGAIHLVSPIDFTAPLERTFVAIFFDQGGLRTHQEIIVTLHCNETAACDGVCIDLSDNPEHCGACEHVCDDNATCGDGACACNNTFFSCENESCVPERDVCDRGDDCGDGSDEAGCCFADGDCALGSRCVNNRCEAGCRDNNRCPANQQCRNNRCVAGCERDASCFENEYCGDNSRCAVGCRNDGSCRAGQICEAHVCVAGCRADPACGNGRICVGESCRAGCRDDGACGDDRICTNLTCSAGCRNDVGCDDGQICSNLSCVAGCRQNDACAPNQICQAARCVAGCQVDEVCPAGEICIDGQCDVGCNEAQPCPDQFTCREGLCRAGCLRDSDCDDNEYCDGVCNPHVCGDGRLAANEDCEPTGIEGCSAQCELVIDGDRLVEGAEPHRLVLDAQGHAQILLRMEVRDDTDHFVVNMPSAGVLRLETLSWTGAGCEGDTVMYLNRDANGPGDDDGGQEACSLLTIENDAMAVQAGDQAIEVTGYGGGTTGFNWLIVDFVPMVIGSDCVVDGVIPCPEGSYCAADTTVCTEHACGDGVIDDANEQCDDANDVDGDGCEACQFGPVPLGGGCALDDLPNCAEGLACHPTDLVCVTPQCGDGFLFGDEPCDDGDMDALNGCNEACQFSPFNGAAEPDALDAAYALPIAENRGAVIFVLDADGDDDFFSFELLERAHVRISNEQYPAGGCQGAPYLTLHHADGALLGEAEDFCEPIDTQNAALGVPGPLLPGQYVVSVVELDGLALGAHWLIVEVTPDRLQACEDTIDNDEDGLVDAADPGCARARDDDEADPAEPAECSDGIDNDADELIDYPNDPECQFAGQGNEAIACPGFEGVAVMMGQDGGQAEVITAGRENLLEASCADRARGGEVPLIVTLDVPSHITVETVDGDFDTAIYSREGCEVAAAELACDDDGGAGTLSRLETQRDVGVHYFFVDGYGIASGTAQVQVTVVPVQP